jgi:ABC-type sugar transport system ATPase subunit
MTTTAEKPISESPSGGDVPLVELKGVGKSYGNIIALKDVNLRVGAGQVTGVLGDNGAGKSTLIKIIAGLHKPTEGELLVDGRPMEFESPKDALANGISTVYQDLAVVSLMPVWRNFFLGQELRKKGFLRSLDINAMRATTISELHKMGIDLPDVDAPIGSLSGGRSPRPHPRRTDGRAGRQAVGHGAPVHHRRQGSGLRGHLHHPQPAPRPHGGGPLRAAQPRTSEAGLRVRRDQPRAPHPADGRW